MRPGRRQRAVGLTSLVLLVGGAGGCRSLGIPVTQRRIIRVSTFYNTRGVWLNFDSPPTDVPEGLKFTIFLSAAGRDLGVFGDGTLIVEMFRVDRNEIGEPVRVLVKKWSFNTKQAYVFRIKEPTRYGWAYGMRLSWGDADVLGREIEVITSFKRHDGTIVYGRPMLLKVPKRVFANRP